MSEPLVFETRGAFRAWLEKNHGSTEGVWLVFGNPGGPQTLKVGEALEEALCYGWIDGQMRGVDQRHYIKYFKQRGDKSNWSAKNKKLVAALEEKGLLAGPGRAKIEAAKANGSWNAPPPAELAPEQLEDFLKLLRPHRQACENYQAMTPSVQRAYAKSYYLGAKTEAGRAKSLERILQRLALGLNPMESLEKALERQGQPKP